MSRMVIILRAVLQYGDSMPDLWPLPYQLAWPVALTLTWMLGEMAHRWSRLPRISVYGLAGFGFGNLASAYLPPSEAELFMLLANLAFGLILFELGYRINLRWLQRNPWLLLTSLIEATCTFVVVWFIASQFGIPSLSALLLAALAMSTSPAGVLRVVNEQCSSGQVTERVMHHSAINCVLAVFSFKVIIGFGLFQSSGDLLHAAWNSLAVLAFSAFLGALMGVWVPAWLGFMGRDVRDSTVAFAFAVALLVAVTHLMKFSPVLATLTFGLVARHRRVCLNRTERNFGVLGDLMAVLLFFFIATTLKTSHVLAGLPLALLLVLGRVATKTAVVTAFAHLSGISWRKGWLTGLALTPMSVFAILLLEQTRRLGVDLVDTMVPLSALALLLEVAGPILTQRALILAQETPAPLER